MSTPKLTTPRSGWGGRGYRIPGRSAVYPGVTTVLKVVAKPGIDQWIADQTAAKAVVSLNYLQTLEAEVAWRKLRFYWSSKAEIVGSDVRLYWQGTRDDAAELGTNIHEWIDATTDGLVDPPTLDAVEAEQMAHAWSAWARRHDVVVHRSEFTCVNDELGFAGTADGDWTITCTHDPDERGRFCLGPERTYRTLVDLKSSKHTWPEHGYQLAALASCPVIMREVTEGTEGAQRAEKTVGGKKVRSWWVEDARPAWERYALLHIRPDDLDKDGDDVYRFARLIDRTEDLDVYRAGFVGALALASSQVALKARVKTRAKQDALADMAWLEALDAA